MTRDYWENCITHFDEEARRFVHSYFGGKQRRCLLVAAAGFDPRSQVIPGVLAETLGARLSALFIRERRPHLTPDLMKEADANEAKLKQVVPNSCVKQVDIFGEDGAVVGGSRVAAMLRETQIDASITDIVLDMSALSIGIGFPTAKALLDNCEDLKHRAFHIMIVSNPEIDDLISSEFAEQVIPVKGFADTSWVSPDQVSACVWMPHLSKGCNAPLTKIGLSVKERYKTCPVLPFPARDPRRADALIREYENEIVNEWLVDPRDLIYVSERNPLDSYRTISTLKQRYDWTVQGTYAPMIVLSPIGGKVMAVGALMAAIEHNLAVQYVETVRYEFDGSVRSDDASPDIMVHVLLSGPIYCDYGKVVTMDPK